MSLISFLIPSKALKASPDLKGSFKPWFARKCFRQYPVKLLLRYAEANHVDSPLRLSPRLDLFMKILFPRLGTSNIEGEGSNMWLLKAFEGIKGDLKASRACESI